MLYGKITGIAKINIDIINCLSLLDTTEHLHILSTGERLVNEYNIHIANVLLGLLMIINSTT